MGEVIDMNGGTRGDVPVVDVLENAKKLQMVTIMGYDADGNEYFATSSGDYQENAWLAGRFIKLLMEAADNE